MTEQIALPVDGVLDALAAALDATGSAVLVAQPGAGKTTRVPLHLLGQHWLAGQKVLVLEPRRLAARSAAEHMARLRGERVGDLVGIRARLDTKVGPATRIEMLTEGVFTRRILDDPELSGVGAVIFDEFHERSLDADLGLALALDARAGLRPDLRIVVMSATLDSAAVSGLLGGAPIVSSHGKAFPVETRYLGHDARGRVDDDMTRAILLALRDELGSVLAFLPGQAEIRRVAARLDGQLPPHVHVLQLHGGLDASAQSAAIAPVAPPGRKVVLATSIAETSITIEGVRVVIDSGHQRQPRYEHGVGITRLETVRVSRAAADQRRGRAGRSEPGVCYRLWSEAETAGLLPFSPPEILSADLAPLVLDCAAWGETDPPRLAWLDAPPAGALAAARAELVALDAIDGRGQMTPLGRRLRALPLPTRLARMLLAAGERGAAEQAADIAAVLVERNLGGRDVDLADRLARFRLDRSQRAVAMRRLAVGWARAARGEVHACPRPSASTSDAELLALAYPERIARSVDGNGRFLLANGRRARLGDDEPLRGHAYLLVADLAGTAAEARILLAAATCEEDVLEFAKDRITVADELVFDSSSAALRGRRVRRLGAIVVASEPRPVPADLTSATTLARGAAQLGVQRLPWTRSQAQLRHRIGFVRAAGDTMDWPDLADATLAETAEQWLAPFIIGRMRLADIAPSDLDSALAALIPWETRRRLDAEAPTHYQAPTGHRVAIDYEGEVAPVLRIRVQELFGSKVHPAVANGRLPLTLDLLSPAGRTIQVTRDLPGFWRGSWADVRIEMKGRYPKHVWPEDPREAKPTARAKPRTR